MVNEISKATKAHLENLHTEIICLVDLNKCSEISYLTQLNIHMYALFKSVIGMISQLMNNTKAVSNLTFQHLIQIF